MDKAIMAANERQIYFTNDDEEIRAYEMREMALMDERARMSYAANEGRTEGHKEGLREGLNKGKIEIARNALQEGFTPEIVQKITGLSDETIIKLKNPKS